MTEAKETEKTPKASKSLLAVGPTLHYSHSNVQRCWLLAVVAFCVACLIWSRLVTGTFWAFDLDSPKAPDFWRLGQAIVGGASIFEYPWQIVVLGLLMGILAVVPILISQLMSFGHSIIFILAVFFLASMPGFALTLGVSCFAVACRPLRFRSRIIAIALCTAPQLLYWGFLGAPRGAEPLEWGFSYAPWILAWIVGLGIATLVLGIGHYTRYRPGLNWIFTTTTLLLALAVFEWQIGFDELDYQFYVADANPEEMAQFHDHNLREVIDQAIMDPATRKTLTGLFLPQDLIPLRKELKREIQIQLNRDDQWPRWFESVISDDLKYQERRDQLNEQYDRFINPQRSWWMPARLHQEIVKRRSRSQRMPIAMYYRALLSELSPDLPRIDQDEVLHFYSDFAHQRSGELWWALYYQFGTAPEAAEARWRIASFLAGRGRFSSAVTYLAEAQDMVEEQLGRQEEDSPESESLYSAFRPPADTIMTAMKLRELYRRIRELQMLIGEENREGAEGATARLARFVALNPHSLDYEGQLRALLAATEPTDGLRDNLRLALTRFTDDDETRAVQLAQLHQEYRDKDGGIKALYELTRLRIGLNQRAEATDAEKRQLLAEARQTLTDFLNLYPDSFYADQVQKNLDDLGKPE